MYFFVLIFSIFISSASFAEELSHSGHSLFINNPQNWEIGKDLFGIPFILFSPQKNGQRSNISFAHTGAELELEVSALKKNQKQYQENKKNWAKIHSADIKGFLPYQSYLNHHQHRVHNIGFEYLHQNKHYVENSFYIECKGKVVFSKSLRLKSNEEHEAYFKSLINSLDCGVI